MAAKLAGNGSLHPAGRETARAAGLRYVSDARPGITRRRAGRHFSYLGRDGEPVRDRATLRRIKALAIPPAWTDVWICPLENGHIQASGRDEKGRKQYRYHPRWQEVRDETKYHRMLLFGEALPGLRERVAADMARRGLPRQKVLATVVHLLDTTFIRVGNEEYARKNDSYGLTTLQNEHVDVHGATVRFRFRGKSGKEQEVELRDRRVATVIRRCQDLPGEELFQYVDEAGELRAVDSHEVNEYLRNATGQDFTAKEFRTWGGTVLAYCALRDSEAAGSAAQAKRTVAEAIRQVAARLGNTPAVCRKCYVHPAVLEAYLDSDGRSLVGGLTGEPTPGLTESEAATLCFLKRQAEGE
jgi:DNA topoisomerase-1